MLEFLEESLESPESEALQSAFEKIDKDTARVIDLGCGNGSMLFALREEGWNGRLLGVDYAEKSVAFAKKVQETRKKQAVVEEHDNDDGDDDDQKEEIWKDVEFQTWDVLNGDYDDLLEKRQQQPGTETKTESRARGEQGKKGTWDLVLDKGTFDAISLSSEVDAQGRKISEGYAGRVLDLLRDDGAGIFLITSCNWTEQELKAWIEEPISIAAAESTDGIQKKGEKKYRMRQIGRVKYPSFSFGGVQGSTICTLCFVKEAVPV